MQELLDEKALLHLNHQFSGNQTYIHAIASLMLYSTSLQYGGGTDSTLSWQTKASLTLQIKLDASNIVLLELPNRKALSMLVTR